MSAGRHREIALLFLKLGVTGFGGPAAHISMMFDEVVKRRQWLTEEEFLDLMGATNLIPGPNSTEMAIHLGHRRGGWPGLLLAGSCFIGPAALIVLACAWAYVEYGSLPDAAAVLYGVKAVIIGVVAQALWQLVRKAVKTVLLGAICAGGVVLSVGGVNELLVLLIAGVAAIIGMHGARAAPALLILAQSGTAPAAAAVPYSLWSMFLFFVKAGSVLFGSGYVLLAFLEADLVRRWHWLSESQLLDAIAVGQVTPGPVFTTATFIGYYLGGMTGAAVATLGIFLPAFFFVAVSGPLVPRIRGSATASAALDGVNAGSLSLMTVVSYTLAREAFVDIPTIMLATFSCVLLMRLRVNSAWLVLAGAIVGLAVQGRWS